jgi:hypothetical protein
VTCFGCYCAGDFNRLVTLVRRIFCSGSASLEVSILQARHVCETCLRPWCLNFRSGLLPFISRECGRYSFGSPISNLTAFETCATLE